MPRHVAILHGWSDHPKSFKPLARFLKRHGFRTVPIFLGGYTSLRDDVAIDDVAKRMEEVVREKMALPTTHRQRLGPTFDLIVHSTGGLVARRWLSMHYADRACPLRNLVMLAPANFGSRLAHLGRTMLGRLFKGLKTDFETGAEMLHALELGSPFQWDLAQNDLFIPEGATSRSTPVYYAPDRIRPFVIVGTHPYPELFAKITNEDGSDGTVRVAAANMNAYGMTVDFSGGSHRLVNPEVRHWKRRGGDALRFPLAVLPDRTHGSVVHPESESLSLSKDPAVQRRLGDLILEALAVNTAKQYRTVVDDWKAVSMETRVLAGGSDEAQRARNRFFRKSGTPREHFHEYYQVVVRAEDEFGEPIPDYFLTFVPKQKGGFFNLQRVLPKEGVFFHDEVLESVHRHERQPAHRTLYIDRFDLMRKGGFYDRITGNKPRELHVSVTAADPGPRIAYFTRTKSLKRGLVRLHQRDASSNQRWLQRHSTHFIKVIVPRAADPGIMTLART